MVNVVGTSGNDDISGTDGDDDLRGLDGNDIIRDTLGHNYIDGGLGADTFVFGANSGGGVYVNLSFSGYQDVGGAQFSFNGIEGVYGTGYADILIGSSGNESLGGGLGDDTLRGMGGNDILHGDDGYDMVYGGDGDDILSDFGGGRMFGDDGNDTITVVQSAQDALNNGNIFLIDGGDGDDTIDFFAQKYRHADIYGGAGADMLLLQYGEAIVDAGDGADTIVIGRRVGAYIAGTLFDVTTGAGGDTIKLYNISQTDITPTATDFSIAGATDRVDLSYYTSGQYYADTDEAGNWIHPIIEPATPYSFANGLLRLVQEGADTLIQASGFFPQTPAREWTMPIVWSPILRLENVTASSLDASHLGLAPGQIWTQGGLGNDRFSGTAGVDYLLGRRG
jgi:Ca2+-binding RTX toxin-like protein